MFFYAFSLGNRTPSIHYTDICVSDKEDTAHDDTEVDHEAKLITENLTNSPYSKSLESLW